MHSDEIYIIFCVERTTTTTETTCVSCIWSRIKWKIAISAQQPHHEILWGNRKQCDNLKYCARHQQRHMHFPWPKLQLYILNYKWDHCEWNICSVSTTLRRVVLFSSSLFVFFYRLYAWCVYLYKYVDININDHNWLKIDKIMVKKRCTSGETVGRGTY